MTLRRRHADRWLPAVFAAHILLAVAVAAALWLQRRETQERRLQIVTAIQQQAIRECERQNQSNRTIRIVLEEAAKASPPVDAARLRDQGDLFAQIDCRLQVRSIPVR